MPEAVARVGPLWTAASVGVKEIDLVHERTADSTVRFEPARTFDKALTDLGTGLENMAVKYKYVGITNPYIFRPEA